MHVIDVLVPVYGDVPEVMPLGSAGTTAMLMNASRLFRSKGMDWFSYYNQSGNGPKFPTGPVGNWNTNGGQCRRSMLTPSILVPPGDRGTSLTLRPILIWQITA